MGSPDPPDGRRAHAQRFGHRRPAPVGGSKRLLLNGEFDEPIALCGRNRLDSARAGLVFENAG